MSRAVISAPFSCVLATAVLLAGTPTDGAAAAPERGRVKRAGPANVVYSTDPALHVGSEACGECHEGEDMPADPRATAHLPLFLEGRYPPHLSGCEACHGPAAEHADSGDSDDIVSFPDLAPRERSAVCLQCHGGQHDRVNFARSAHDQNQVACTDCHRVHEPEADGGPREACWSCHAEVRADFAQPFKHPLDEGVVSCVDCHAQHGSFGRPLRRLGGEAPCGSCHQDKQGPFVFGHVGRWDGGCLGCHSPHGSPNPHQLLRHDVNALCLECHVNTPSGHDQADGIHDRCVICHSQIHGSNIDRYFNE